MKTLKRVFLFLFACQSYAQIADFNHIDFKKADSIALTCKNEGLYNLPLLSHKLTANLTTDVERFRAIYIWVCTNIENDYKLYLKNERKTERYRNDSLKLNTWNTDFKKVVFNTLIEDQKTLCTGYAYLVKALASLSNLDCEIIHGYGKTSTTDLDKLYVPNHSWNGIKLNGKWYLCDPTWASGSQNPVTFEFNFQYNNGFFLTNPELFAINHYPEDEKWMLLENERPLFHNFLEAPILYGNAYKNLTEHGTPKQLHNTIKKHDKVRFTYELLKPVSTETIRLLIDNGYGNKKTRPTLTLIENNSLTLEHQFNAAGFYDVHLLIGDDLISTYTVEVKS